MSGVKGCVSSNSKETTACVHQVSSRHLKNVIDGFERKWDFPSCAGAIDGTHVPIVAPQENHTDYFNRKGWYSIVMQAVIDDNYCF